MKYLHITASFSTYGCLRNAVQNNLLEGEAFCMNEIPGIGPLQEMNGRTEFWKKINESEFFSDLEHDGKETHNYFSAEANWIELNQRLKDPDLYAVLWIGNTNNDYVFLRMCCHYINDTKDISFVQIPFEWEHAAVEYYPPEILAPMIKEAVVIPADENSRLGGEFLSIASNPGQLRELNDQGEMQFLKIDHYDQLILNNCSMEWKNIIKVITDTLDDYYKPKKNRNYILFYQFCFFRIGVLIKARMLEKRERENRIEIRLSN
ncbi:hypothetical protein M2347_000552 [Chryseobacterium sp. H1D6B]|uniref:DUF1835 domain-containing protein n=1 Tax=Chryseobacterium sp. H1D6B TaxID=2940588 RepID=UPI0015C75F38|nr:DUF3658 domain-containing protein [Chryseobacterium sp. H1D6B]MDH6250825.1 hypothetical protein [Chryseobacterium sp. H1D6B]